MKPADIDRDIDVVLDPMIPRRAESGAKVAELARVRSTATV